SKTRSTGIAVRIVRCRTAIRRGPRSLRSKPRSRMCRGTPKGRSNEGATRGCERVIGGFVAVGVGAALGAWLRWGLSAWLNGRIPHFPLGTLAANLLGGYLIGFAVAW